MKPVTQTVTTVPGGNCFSACVASLLELSIDEVPYFMSDPETWWERFLDWLRPRGYYALCVPYSTSWWPNGYHIIGGRSPRDTSHAVVGLGEKIVHDPHPDRTGLVKREDVTLLVPIDPGRWRLP